MLCSLSGQIPTEPVASLKSGHVFEKRLLLKYLEQNQQRCPVTNEELDADKDLLAIQQPTTSSNSSNNTAHGSKSASAFSPESASIPQLLSLFQNEWDAAMLETFTLKQHLEKTRQELSHALYQHDAACRVIARLNEENKALRAKLTARASSTNTSANGSEDVDMDQNAGLSVEAIATIEAKQKELAKKRKDFKKKDAPARAELLAQLDSWTVKSNHTLHDSDKPGVLSVAIDPKQPERVATGGVDKHAKVFDTKSQQIVATLAGHSKKVSHTSFHASADLIVTASHDKTVKLWSPTDKGYSVAHTLEGHDDAVTSASIHATGDYLISGSLDASWGFHDLRSGKLLTRYFLNGETSDPKNANGANELLALQFHPDGGIFGTASKQKVLQMWDVKSFTNVATFEGHTAQVNTLCFSENGYQLASGAHDGIVKFWDLRKLKSYFEIDLNASTKMGTIHEVHYDASGSYLAVAGSHLQVLKETGKTEWQVVKTFDDHKAVVTGVKFAPDSSYLASTSMDRSLKIFR
uniref:Pre-mRNA-processing factor 19 n=1 Tax=Globisporangium ultimum (strain ATCC 200006 / CBS 805.95 / DAOM BR144) TaxID=431595 RepID=K3WXH6_GLOUD